MKKHTDEGKIERLYNGVYYRSYKTILGTKGKVSVDKFIQKRYLDVDGRQIIVYKPVVEISKENKGALQFLKSVPSCFQT